MRIIPMFAVALLVSIDLASAQDNSEWFASQRMPGANAERGYVVGTSCCDKSDGRVTSVRMGPHGIQAWVREIDGWIDIPPNKIIYESGNPMPGAVLWYLPRCGVLCFADHAGG